MLLKTLAVLMLSIIYINNVSYASGNLLKNPGFEVNSGPESKAAQSWTPAGGNVFHIWDNEYHGGNFSFKFWWAGNVVQSLPVVPGSEYRFSGWLCNPLSEPLPPKGTKSAFLKMEFISADKGIICVKESERFDRDREAGKWYQLKVKGFAPPNTARIKVSFEMKGGDGGGVIIGDDMSLEILRTVKPSSKLYSINLEGDWLFQKGDKPEWAKSILANYEEEKWR
ncbi:MAG: hypothetical protein ABII64_04565 [Elusimicrobiota bacterium]